MTLYQLFPTLDPATESALRASIERWGVLVPVAVDQHGNIIDGHHRQAIAAELDLDCPTQAFEIADDDHARELATTLNMTRRHLSIDQRRELVTHLRQEGHSMQAIADALGVSKPAVQRDLSNVSTDTMPDRITTSDGRSYPATRPQPGDTVTDCDGHAHQVDELIPLDGEDASIVLDTDGDYTIVENEPPDPPISKPDLDGNGLSHPARYSPGMTGVFRDLIRRYHPEAKTILDPFAGAGGIHDLYDEWETTGVELEPEWADLHHRTLCGNALDLDGCLDPSDTFDVICTSPAYGNRLADNHDASDPDRRRSYKHDLGHDPDVDNSGTLQWGDDYRAFHLQAWEEIITRLPEYGGLFILNIKDHIRAGERQPVSAFHARTFLVDINAYVMNLRNQTVELLDCVPFRARNLQQGTNAAARVDAELVWVFGVNP